MKPFWQKRTDAKSAQPRPEPALSKAKSQAPGGIATPTSSVKTEPKRASGSQLSAAIKASLAGEPIKHSNVEDDPIRVLFLLDGLEDPDLDPLLADISNSVHARGHLTGVVFLGHAPAFPTDDMIKSGPALALGRSSVSSAANDLQTIVEEHQPDVLVAGSDFSRAAVSLMRSRTGYKPHVVFYDNGDAPRVFAENNRFGKGADPTKADIIVCTSHHRRAQISSLISDKTATPVVAVPPPIYSSQFEERVSGQTRHPWINHASAPLLLSFDPLLATREQLSLIELIAIANTHLPSRFLFLGRGPGEAKMREHIAAAGAADRIDIITDIIDPAPFVRAAAGVISTGPATGVARGIIEAIAMARPIVAFNQADAVSELLSTRYCGHLVPPNDPTAILDAICAVLRRSRELSTRQSPRMVVSKNLDDHTDLCLGAKPDRRMRGLPEISDFG